jgi:hypothetical protein
MKCDTIEDLLEILAGFRQASKIQIESSDATIMHSIARQVFKGTALTDRQYALMKEKLQTYRDQFVALEYNFDVAIETLRKPLREIDRSKYIKIVNHGDMLGPNSVYESYKSKWRWIKVRFPFSKTLITSIHSLPHSHNEYYHEKGSHEHFFLLTESNVFNVVNEFKEKNFEISTEVLELYNKVTTLEKSNYEIKVENFQLLNMHPNGVKQLQTDLGDLSAENVIQYKDRSILYGITSFDEHANTAIDSYDILTKKIANRSKTFVNVSSVNWKIDDLLKSLRLLNRYPIVILLNEKDPYNVLSETYQHIRNYIDNSEISVLYRLPKDESNGYNEFIQDRKLNNPLDKNTKVVYTSKSKVNKPLLISECNPITTLSFDESRRSSQLGYWLEGFDLNINYAPEPNIIPYAGLGREIEVI